MPYEYDPSGTAFASGGAVEDTTPASGYGRLFGSAMDRTEASLYGVAEGALGDTYLGRAARDARLDNQIEADTSARKFYQGGTPQSWEDVHGVGDAAQWAAGLAVQSAPVLLGIGAAGLVGSVPGAMAAGSAFGIGDVMDNQRERAGQTDLLSAVPLGLAYGAADSMLGVGGMAARRSLGTGIRALDSTGTKYLDELAGWRGAAARTGATTAKQMGVEGGSETFQEGLNQLGRMSVDPTETFYNSESADRFKESAIGGAALGGLLGGVAGGWRRSSNYVAPQIEADQTVDVLSGGLRTPSLVTEPEPLQHRIDRELGIGSPRYAGKDYVSQFKAAADAPTGRMIADAANGYVERPETALEAQQRAAQEPVAPAIVEQPPPQQAAIHPAVEGAVQQQQANNAQAEQAKAAEAQKQAALQSTTEKYGAPTQRKTETDMVAHDWLGKLYTGKDNTGTPFVAQAVEKQAQADIKRMSTYGMPLPVADQLEQMYASAYRAQQQERSAGFSVKEGPKDEAQPVTPKLFGKDFMALITGAQSLAQVAETVKLHLDEEIKKGGQSPAAAQKISLLEKFYDRLTNVTGKPVAPKQQDTPAASAPSAPQGVTSTAAQPVTGQGAGVSQPTQPVSSKFQRAPKQAAPTPEAAKPVEPKKVGGVAVQNLPYIEPKKTASRDSATSLDISRARETVSNALKHPKYGPLVAEITGLSLDENGALTQIEAKPVPVAQIAEKLKISRQALSQGLKDNLGIDDVVIGRAVGSFTAVQSTAAEDTGAEDVGFNENIRAATYDVDGTQDNDVGADAQMDPDVAASLNIADGDMAADDTVAELGMESLVERGTENSGMSVEDSLAKAAGERFVQVSGVKAIPKIQQVAARALLGDTKAQQVFLTGQFIEDARAAWQGAVPFDELSAALQSYFSFNVAVAEDLGRPLAGKELINVERHVEDQHAKASKADTGAAVPREGAGTGRRGAESDVPRDAPSGGRVGGKTEGAQANAAKKPDAPGRQAAEAKLSPEAQAQIAESKRAIAAYEKVLNCLKGR